MSDAVRIAFERRILVLPMDLVLPLRKLAPGLKDTAKYRRMLIRSLRSA